MNDPVQYSYAEDLAGGLLATLNQSHLHKKQPQDSVKPLLSVLASLLDPEKRGTHGTDTADRKCHSLIIQ